MKIKMLLIVFCFSSSSVFGYTITFYNQTPTKLQASVHLLYYVGNNPVVILEPQSKFDYRAPGAYCFLDIQFLGMDGHYKTKFIVDDLHRCMSMDVTIIYNSATGSYNATAKYHDNAFTKFFGEVLGG